LCGARAPGTQRAGRTRDREKFAGLELKAGDVVRVAYRATRVQDIEQVAVQCQAEGPSAARAHFVGEQKTVRSHGENRNFMAARVTSEEPASIVGQEHRPLIAETAACAGAPSGEAARWNERTIGCALKR